MNRTELLGRVSGGVHLSQAEMAEAIDTIMQGTWPEQEIALLLTALRAKGETVDEVAGAAQAMRKHMAPIRSSRPNLIDTCGTGGDGSATFNISTAAAIVAAAAGASVAKHGNRRMSSRTGSADVLAELGVNIEAEIRTVEACLDELGLAFCFAPLFHAAMRHVGEVRRKLGVPTIFNMLGPLSNPAGAPFQLLGVGRPELRPLLSQALAKLGTRRALVVCGQDGLDEVTLATDSNVSEAVDGTIREFVWSPREFGLEPQPLDPLKVDGPAASAAMIRDILAGKRGAARDIVVLNAAAALWTVGLEPTPAQAATRAADAIDSGAARELLARLAERSHGRA